MEIKAQLNKPFTDKQRADFIVLNNHTKGYEIRETETALEAWGYTEEEKREQEEQAERKRIQALYMTRSDFFDGFILAFNLGQVELRAIIEQILHSINITDVEIKVALNNFDNALNFYRKHTLFTLLNAVEIPINEEMTLVFTSDIWDKFFDETNKRNPEAYKELQKAIKVKPEPELVDTDSDSDTDSDTESEV
jgi:capsule polysaccharide export protein KpsC/LpsZ